MILPDDWYEQSKKQIAEESELERILFLAIPDTTPNYKRLRELAAKALSQWAYKEVLEIIGEDAKGRPGIGLYSWENGSNDLRAEQRQAAARRYGVEG